MALHTSTILARTPTAILSHLSRLSITYSDHSVIFALNANAPELPVLVSRLTKLSAQTIGCLSAPLPGLSSEGGLISCSLAVVDNRNAISFRSTIPGRAAPQVGRWHAFRQRGDKSEEELPPGMENGLSESMNWDDVWDRSAGGNALPKELLQASRPNDINSVIYFSDNAPEGLSNSLASLPHATKLGLIASSTPFITGRPVTLFRNENVHSSGAVGIALTGGDTPKSSIEFPGLRSITPPLLVTRSEGNLVNELDNGNPSKLLIAAIRKHRKGSFKEDDFYLGAFRGDKLNQVYHIMSGDPSRGTIALESHAAPAEGTTVQLYHRPKSTPTEIPKGYSQPQPNQRTLAFVATSSDEIVPQEVTGSRGDDDAIRVLPEIFLASSENGFSLSRSRGGVSESAWRCTVAGGLTSLVWS